MASHSPILLKMNLLSDLPPFFNYSCYLTLITSWPSYHSFTATIISQFHVSLLNNLDSICCFLQANIFAFVFFTVVTITFTATFIISLVFTITMNGTIVITITDNIITVTIFSNNYCYNCFHCCVYNIIATAITFTIVSFIYFPYRLQDLSWDGYCVSLFVCFSSMKVNNRDEPVKYT